MKELNVSIEYHLDSIGFRFDNRRLALYPHQSGVSILFKRLIDADEKIKQKENPNASIQCAGTEIINNRIVKTHINLSYEAAYILADALNSQQREIRIRQILNTMFKGEHKVEAMRILNEIGEADFMGISQMFEGQQYQNIELRLSTLKCRLCADGVLEQKEGDHFGNTINE